MPTLSTHYAIVTLPNGDEIAPISIDVTADETWAPYIQASVVLPSNLITDDIDPRAGSRLRLRLQQDFGDLIYNYELTESYGGSVAAFTAAYAGTQVTRTNLVTNPSFEVDTSTWGVFSPATITRVTSQYYTGTSSLQCVATGNNAGTTCNLVSLTASQTYTFSVYVKGETGKTIYLEILEKTSAGTEVGRNTGFYVTMSGNWQRLNVSRSFGSTGVRAEIRVRNGVLSASHTFYVDAVLLEASNTVNSYFDGSLPDGLNLNNNWTGTANASTSTQLSGNLVNCQEITRDYSQPWNIFEEALPLSTVTTAYTPVTPAKLTAAGLTEVWRMSDFLHSSGTFNPAPSTIFNADLGVRSISYDYVSKQATLELASDEALAQDVHGYGDDVMVTYYDLRSLVNEALNAISANLAAGTANESYLPLGYNLEKYEVNLPNTVWDLIETVTAAGGFKVYCDEMRNWYLIEDNATAGSLVLNDTDNITAFQKVISRDTLWYNQAVIEYQVPDSGVNIFDTYYASGTGELRTLYMKKENMTFPGMGAAQSIVQRSLTRGETYTVEAIANFDARPRQELTVDITDEPVKTGIVQSITWSLPSARMSVDIRDLQEV